MVTSLLIMVQYNCRCHINEPMNCACDTNPEVLSRVSKPGASSLARAM